MSKISVIASPWDDLLINLIKETNRHIIVVSPWIKKYASDILIKSINQENINNIKVDFYTRLNTTDLINRNSDIEAYEDLFKSIKNFKLFCINNLHAKIYVFDFKKVLITSGNFTTGGILNNLELGVLITEDEVCKQFKIKLNDIKEIIDPTPVKVINDIIESLKNYKLENLSEIVEKKKRDNTKISFGRNINPKNLIMPSLDIPTVQSISNFSKAIKSQQDESEILINQFFTNSLIKDEVSNIINLFNICENKRKIRIIDLGRHVFKLLINLKLPEVYSNLNSSYIIPILVYLSSNERIISMFKSKINDRRLIKNITDNFADKFCFLFGQLLVINEFQMINEFIKKLDFHIDQKEIDKIASEGTYTEILETLLLENNQKLEVKYDLKNKIEIQILINNKLCVKMTGEDKRALQRQATIEAVNKININHKFQKKIEERQNALLIAKNKEIKEVTDFVIPEWRKKKLEQCIKGIEINKKYLPLLNIAFTHKSWTTEHRLSIPTCDKYSTLGHLIFFLFCSSILSNYEVFINFNNDDYYHLIDNLLLNPPTHFNFSHMILIGSKVENKKKSYRKSFLAFLYIYFISNSFQKTFELISSLVINDVEKLLQSLKQNKDVYKKLDISLKDIPYLPEYTVLEPPSRTNHYLYKVAIYLGFKKISVGYGQTFELAKAKAAGIASETIKYSYL